MRGAAAPPPVGVFLYLWVLSAAEGVGERNREKRKVAVCQKAAVSQKAAAARACGKASGERVAYRG